MRADKVMRTKFVLCRVDETVGDVLLRMREHGLRMLPVVDEEERLVGAVWTCGLLARIVPEYILEGELKEVHFAPDLGLLHRRYQELVDLRVQEVMDPEPMTVQEDESLLSVAASIVAHGAHPEFAFVVDAHRRLKGLISAGDVLDALIRHANEGAKA